MSAANTTTNAPLNLQLAVMQYWQGVYGQDKETVKSLLAEDVTVITSGYANTKPLPAQKLKGRDAVVEVVMKIGSAIKCIDNVSLTFSLVEKNKTQMLRVQFEQKLTLKQNSETPEKIMESDGVQLWKWKEIKTDDGKSKILFTFMEVIENDIFK